MVRRCMKSPPLDSTHSRTTSGVARHHRPSTVHTVGRRQEWHDITSLGQHTRSDYVRRGMTSPPLYITHDRTTSGVACHHCLWATQTIERCRAGHAIIGLGRETRLNNVRRDMPSLPLESTHDRTKSGLACHHHLCAAHTVERRLAWHDITALGLHARSNDVERAMTSPPLDNKHGL